MAILQALQRRKAGVKFWSCVGRVPARHKLGLSMNSLATVILSGAAACFAKQLAVEGLL